MASRHCRRTGQRSHVPHRHRTRRKSRVRTRRLQARRTRIRPRARAAGIVPKPPPPAPRPHVVGAPQVDPTAILAVPWQQRVIIPEPPSDASQARNDLRTAIGERSEAAAALDLAEDALDRADALILNLEEELAAHAQRADARETDLADRIRAWISAGSAAGARPEGGIPEPPGRTAAELAGARAARITLAAEVDTATTTHTRAIEAVDHCRRLLLAAAGQELIREIDAAEAALAELRVEAFALINTHVGGQSVYHGTLKSRTSAEPPQSRDLAPIAARFADYAARLTDDADAEL
jgi:hypothetical protein